MTARDQLPIALIGAGKIGEMITELLVATGDYRVTLIDASADRLQAFDGTANVDALQLDVTDEAALSRALTGHFAVLSATPFYLTTQIAQAAHQASIHYLDLTEDVASTEAVKGIAEGANSAFIPQCGLAPGFISIVTYDIASRFESLDTIRMCVGALPQYPSTSLNYNLTWSTDGVINEYCEPCMAIQSGELRAVPPLEQLEHFSLDGIGYESFNTSGGIGTLAETLKGQVRHLSYQTIRYPGHRDIMKTLLHDLGLRDRRDLLRDVLENAVPATMQDVVLIFVTVSGKRDGQLLQETYANKIYSAEVGGKSHSAIQITTAASICAVLDLLAEGHLPQQGFVTQEEIALTRFLDNRFGRYFRQTRVVHEAA
ncbi:MAG: saccharopine dehydrogenase C-terminal domain-containing protein [Pseudomonadales bacterium]